MARKPKLDKELIEKIRVLIANGNTDKAALNFLNVGHTAYYGWLQQGELDKIAGKDTLKSELVDTLTRARATAEINLVQIITKAAVKDWKAALAILERRYKEEWKLTTVTEIEDKREVTIKLPAGFEDPTCEAPDDSTG